MTVGDYATYVFSRSKTERKEAEGRLSKHLIWNTKFGLSCVCFGFLTGAYLGGKHRALQFLAENAHRLPKTVGGWYFYHKYKNYEMVNAGIKSGLRYSVKFGLIGLSFSLAESGMEYIRSREDGLNAVFGGVGSALLVSGATRLGYYKRSLQFGLGIGLVIGLMQEMTALMTGKSLKYPNETRKKWTEYETGQWIQEMAYQILYTDKE
jgi:hypothetical protein